MKSARLVALLTCVFVLICAGLHAQKSDSELRVYFIDVEGGQSTLFVTPDHRSLLIDTGWPDHQGRDGVPQLVDRIPVGTFIDHGPLREPGDKATAAAYSAYQKVLATGKYKHIVAEPGMMLPVPGLTAEVLTADGRYLEKPLPGAGQPNPYCKESEHRPADQTENSRSIGTLLTWGKVRILDLGDLTWDKEMDFLCPDNRIGHVDILVVSHHGWYQSSSPALVDAIAPRIAIMDNGATKGGSKPTVETLRKIPGLEALWQLHYSEEAGPDNEPAKFIANLHGPDSGYGFELRVSRGGSFSVTNARTKATTDYGAH
jgi:competence protein ComEC